MSETPPAAPAAPAPAGPPYKNLTDSPTNLKEAIDWILRVTNKDGQGEKPSEKNCLCPLSQAVVTVLRDVRVKDYLDHEEEETLVSEILSSIETIGGVRTTRNLIEAVANQLQQFIGWKEGGGIQENNKDGIAQSGYTSAYSPEAKLDKDKLTKGDSWTTLAKIFLGCIPFIFSGLSYMYCLLGVERDTFREKQSDGKYKTKHELIGAYMERMGYKIQELVPLVLGTEENGNPVVNVFSDVFKDSNILGNNQVDGKMNTMSFAEYLEKVRAKVREEVKKKGDPGRNDFEGFLDDSVPTEEITDDTPSHALLKLNTLCTGYFRALNQPYRVHRRQHRLPRTIREILYWLSCVQYCPVFRVLVQKMQQLCQRNGEGSKKEIKFYGSDWEGKPRECIITPSNCVSYFLSAALVAPMVLLSIQDTIESRVGNVKPSSDAPKVEQSPEVALTEEQKYHQKIDKILAAGNKNGGVPIHDLYANTLFEFRFPMSETESYYLLQDCLVALYYQLYFIMKQCYWGRTTGYGWGYCKYGADVSCDKCLSWICKEAVTKGKEYLKKQQNQRNYGLLEQNDCGQKPGYSSPLQAFLTDCLKGFTCPVVMEKKQSLLKQLRSGSTSTDKNQLNKAYEGAYPEFLEHRGHTNVFGTECAVPMGFSGSFKTAAAGPGNGMIGLGIEAVVFYYADDDISSSSLYQLVRCISSLTRRVPRSTGTLYGFFYGLGQVAFYSNRGQGQTEFKNVLSEEMLRCPGYREPSCLLDALMEWTETDHIKNHKKTQDQGNYTLGSLYMCGDNNTNGSASCGSYLKPLTGSMYNSVSRVYCDTYVSWIVYLTGVLQSGLESLLKEFVKIDCSTSGCTQKGGGTCQCEEKGCTPGTHGVVTSGSTNTDGCCCTTIADCAGVLGLLYRFGFSFNSPGYVANHQKRKCDKFYQQLQNVIEKGLFTTLQTQLRKFIYSTRALFGLYIGVYWSIVLLYLLWSMTVNLDLMHIQSHWRSPGSYLVPLQRILADGSRNVKRVCTMKYFSDGTGNGLLEQGINDLYL